MTRAGRAVRDAPRFRQAQLLTPHGVASVTLDDVNHRRGLCWPGIPKGSAGGIDQLAQTAVVAPDAHRTVADPVDRIERRLASHSTA